MANLVERPFRETMKAARSWTSLQFIILKGAIISLMVTAINFEVQSQKSNNQPSMSRYMLITFLVIIMVVVSLLEKWYHVQEDRRADQEMLSQKIIEVQSGTISYIFNDLLDKVDGPQEALQILEKVPAILGVMSLSNVQEIVGDGYRSMVEAMATLGNNIQSIREETVNNVRKDLMPLLQRIDTIIEGYKVPKPEIRKE